MGLNVTYKGQQIAQLTEGGNLTLETAGKYCEGDIGLAYSGGGGSSGFSLNDIAVATLGPGYISPIEGDAVINGYVLRPYCFYQTQVKTAKITLTGNVSGWSLSERAFSYCYKLEDVLYNPPQNGIGGIQQYAFWECVKLKRVRITGNVTYINGQPFGACPLLTDIYVTWAEGAISGAPWGATNATIHYNTVFDADGEVVS